jgi:hypothetical protein
MLRKLLNTVTSGTRRRTATNQSTTSGTGGGLTSMARRLFRRV